MLREHQLRSVRGMHDVPPSESWRWRRLEHVCAELLERYGYQQVRLPHLEHTELFTRSIGPGSDVVSKEMYCFTDGGGDQLSLRPEGTAGCVRAGIEHGWFRQAQRLWYLGPMFRRERPQRGRYRQFHQIGVEAYGMAGPDIDAELLLLGQRLWSELGLEGLSLELNHLGAEQSRRRYRERLREYFADHREHLDAEAQRKLQENPLRLLDSKDPALQPLIQAAPGMESFLETSEREHFAALQALLDAQQIRYCVNPRLVRGLDYYSGTVFEWISTELGAQNAIGAGGRYDQLVSECGGPPTPALGFAAGLERILVLLETAEQQPPGPHAYLILHGETATKEGLHVAETLRARLHWLRLLTHCGGGSLKSQLRKADRSGARMALILGEEEWTQQKVSVKMLRSDLPQQQHELSALPDLLTGLLSPVPEANGSTLKGSE